MNRIYIIILSFSFLLFTQINIAKASDQNEISTLVTDFFNNISQEDHIEASKLFHYPTNYTQEEVNQDIEGVSKFLQALGDSFGNISDATIYNGNSKIISLQIGGGDIPYWQKHPNYLSKVYAVKFSKYGSGYITLTLCNIANKYEIREAKYGLDASFRNSTMLLQEAASHVRILFENK